ncbi:TPA: hypothetical protein DF272_04720, partial [Candidatus Falkowbacteria bacterium]|nr:hypothetical protein [Candidatus Falkowbacteria bacterium]
MKIKMFRVVIAILLTVMIVGPLPGQVVAAAEVDGGETVAVEAATEKNVGIAETDTVPAEISPPFATETARPEGLTEADDQAGGKEDLPADNSAVENDLGANDAVETDAGGGGGTNKSVSMPEVAVYNDNTKSVGADYSVNADQQTGALNYSFPIIVPAGRLGLTPEMSFQYNSQNQADGILGAGWQMSTLSIQRLNKFGVDQLYNQSVFTSSLSGELMALEVDDQGFGVYGGKIETGAKLVYLYDASGWTIKTKTGLTYYLGNQETARLSNPDNQAEIFAWYITEMTDLNTNSIQYFYDKENNNVYLSRIVYGGDENNEGIYTINFAYEQRPDATVSYSSGFSVTHGRRLLTVDTKFQNQVMKRYGLNYEAGARTNLVGMTEIHYDSRGGAVTLPETQFTYAAESTGFVEAEAWQFPAAFVANNSPYASDQGVRLLDLNGDGLTDVMRLQGNDGDASGVIREFYLNDGHGGWTAGTGYHAPVGFVSANSQSGLGVHLIDVNGDTKQDLVRVFGAERQVYIFDGQNWTLDVNYILPIPPSFNGADKLLRVVDINGDGFQDIIRRDPNINQVFINKADGTGFELAAGWSLLIALNGNGDSLDRGVRFMDINGDSLPDLVHAEGIPGVHTQIQREFYLNTGRGFVQTTEYNLPVGFISAATNVDLGMQIADVNGDGFDDIIEAYAGERKVFLLNPATKSWEYAPQMTVPIVEQYSDGDTALQSADINGDGRVDLIRAEGSDRARDHVYLNTSAHNALIGVRTATGEIIAIEYSATPTSEADGGQRLNPELPLSLQVVTRIERDPGFGEKITVNYQYEGGSYYTAEPRERQFAGFAKITAIDNVGNQVSSYFHQGNGAQTASGEDEDDIDLANRVYRTESRNAAGGLTTGSRVDWQQGDLPNGQKFVRIQTSLTDTYDGGVTARTTAERLEYDKDTLNLSRRDNFGEVAFGSTYVVQDIGDDRYHEIYQYASDGGYVVGLTAESARYNYKNELEGRVQYYYDNLLFGQVSSGNVTREEVTAHLRQDFGGQASTVNTASTVRTYNEVGMVMTETDPAGAVTTISYDEYNLMPFEILDGMGHSNRFRYDYFFGQATFIGDPAGTITYAEYDGLGRILSLSRSSAEQTFMYLASTEYSYDDAANPRVVRERQYFGSNDYADSYTYYDPFGRTIQTRIPGDNNRMVIVDYGYNNLGQLIKQSWPYYGAGSARTAPNASSKMYRQFEYDALGRVTKETAAAGSTMTSYNLWKTTVTDANGKIKEFSSDGLGRLISVNEKSGAGKYVTRYYYNSRDQITKMVNALGHERRFGYDLRGLRTMAEDWHLKGDTTVGLWYYNYNDAGYLVGMTDPVGNNITYIYDAAGRLVSEKLGGVDQISYEYDNCINGAGRLCRVATVDGVITSYEYDARGRVKKETKEIGGELYLTRYEYDRQDAVVVVVYPDGSRLTYTNQNGLVQQVNLDTEILARNIDYTPAGQVGSITYSSGSVSMSTYDAVLGYRLTKKITKTLSGVVQDMAYTYDRVGNITKITEKANVGAARTASYKYDDLYRLIEANITDTVTGQVTVENFKYDAIGNMLSKTGVGSYEYANTGYATPQAATKIGGSVISYDN